MSIYRGRKTSSVAFVNGILELLNFCYRKETEARATLFCDLSSLSKENLLKVFKF